MANASAAIYSAMNFLAAEEEFEFFVTTSSGEVVKFRLTGDSTDLDEVLRKARLIAPTAEFAPRDTISISYFLVAILGIISLVLLVALEFCLVSSYG